MYKESLKHLTQVPLKFDLTFYLLIAILIYSQGFAIGIMYSILFLSAMIVHEYAHAFAGIQSGIKVKVINFGIFGAITFFDVEEPLYNLKNGLTIALSGPFASFVYMCISIIVNMFFQNSMSQFFLRMNVLIFIVNLLPILTLDGGLALFIFLSKYIDKVKALRICYIISTIICIVAMTYSIIFEVYIITFISVSTWLSATLFKTVAPMNKLELSKLKRSR